MLAERQVGRLQVMVAATVGLTAIACATGPRRMYDGDPRSPEEVAVVRENTQNYKTRYRVETIDGKRAAGDDWELLPGEHTIVMTIFTTQSVPGGRYTLQVGCAGIFGVEAGGSYVVDANYEWSQARSQGQFDASIVEASSGGHVGRIDCLGE